MAGHRFVKEYARYVQKRARACMLIDPWKKQGIIYRCEQVIKAYENFNISESEAIAALLSAYNRKDEEE